MICTDEVIATVNRLNLLKKNTENPEEKLGAEILATNINSILRQLVPYFETEEFKKNALKEEKMI